MFSAPLTNVFFLDQRLGWIVDERGQVLSTQDGGNNWVKRGVLEPLASQMMFIDENQGGIVIAGSFLTTNNGGDSWTKSFPTREASNDRRPLGDSITQAFSQTDLNTIWLSTGSGKVFVTVDGGETWEESDRPDETELSALYAESDKEAWLGGYIPSGLFHTTDRGRTWQQRLSAIDLKNLGITSIAFQNREIGWAIGIRFVTDTTSPNLMNGVVFQTIDGGKTWKRLQNSFYEKPFRTIEFNNDKVGWLVGERYIYQTTDGGATWDEVFAAQSNTVND